MKTAIILALSLFAGSAWCADSSPAASPAAPRDPAMEKYTAAKERGDWKSAAAAMHDALARDAQNADYHNLYAYSLRKSGSGDMNEVFRHYNEALRIDSKHRGAHEYLGEAYLMVGNVAKAKEHLAQLDKLCFFGCSEFSELKKAISDYEAKTVK